MNLKDRLSKLEQENQTDVIKEVHIIHGVIDLSKAQAFDRYQEHRTAQGFEPVVDWVTLKQLFLGDTKEESDRILFVYIDIIPGEHKPKFK